MPNPFLYTETVLFQTIQFSISTYFSFTQLNVQNTSFQTTQFSVIIQFSSIWPIDRTPSGVTTTDWSGPRSGSNEEELWIPKIFICTEAPPSDGLVSYPRSSLEVSYPSVEMQLVYSATPTDRANIIIRKDSKANLKWSSPVDRDCRIHRLLLCRRVRPSNECPDMTLNYLMVKLQ